MTNQQPAQASTHGVFGRERVPLHTAAQAAHADRSAREEFDIPSRVLMENAGRAAALVMQRLHPTGRVVGLAGSGNNGGDLLVMLRVLASWGRDVVMIAAGTRPPDPVLAHGSSMDPLSGTAASDALAAADIIVDGMLGTGSAGAPRGSIAAWIDRVNAQSRPVCALDLPSGIDATTGAVHDHAVRAHATVTFGWPKLGLMLHPARAHCGRIIAVEIGFPDACAASDAHLITGDYVRRHLRPRGASAHKGTAGRLLVLAGQAGMAGAAALATQAAIRTGAGLLRVASAAANRVVLQTLVPEATFLDRDTLAPDDVSQLHALVAGPGMGTDTAARAALMRLFEMSGERPMLLDADALNVLATEPGALQRVAAARPVVITPHARELSRLSGQPLDDILADTVGAVRAAARQFGCCVLLKGQPSLIAQPDGALFVASTGSSDVAAAGMGDQLAGVIGALLAGGYDPALAAALGLHLSGRAADLAALGRALSPRDVSSRMADAIAEPGPAASTLDLPFITFDQPARW